MARLLASGLSPAVEVPVSAHGLALLFPQLLQYEMCLNIEDISARLKSLNSCQQLVYGRGAWLNLSHSLSILAENFELLLFVENRS